MSGKNQPFKVYDVVRPKGLRSKHFDEINGARVRFEEIPGGGARAITGLASRDEIDLHIGGGSPARIDRARAAEIIDILARWLASGRLWLEEEEAPS